MRACVRACVRAKPPPPPRGFYISNCKCAISNKGNGSHFKWSGLRFAEQSWPLIRRIRLREGASHASAAGGASNPNSNPNPKDMDIYKRKEKIINLIRFKSYFYIAD
uniref:hypothetical protein n=1 Tax=Dematophora necatrix TaxID=2751867 RepID=UPI0030E54E54